MHIAGNDGDEDRQIDLDLEAGYGSETKGTPPTQTEAKVETQPEQTEQKPQPVEGKKPEAQKPKAEVKKPAAEAPKYRQITEEEFSQLSASAAKTPELERKLDQALGTFGNVKQLVTKLQTDTPKGVQIALNKGFLKKLRTEFGPLAELLEDDLTEAFKGIKGTGGEDPKPSQAVNEDELNARLKASRQKDAEEALEDEFPKWRTIIGEVDSEGKHDPANPYRAWLGKQTAEYQEQINSTDNAYLLARSIRRFRKETAATAAKPSASKVASKAKPSPKQEARKTRIQAAVPLKSAGSPTKPRNSADDDFEAGYASERAG